MDGDQRIAHARALMALLDLSAALGEEQRSAPYSPECKAMQQKLRDHYAKMGA